MCCMRLTENTGLKNDAKSRHLGTIAQLCRVVSSQLRHLSTIRKKLVKQQYLLHMCTQYDEVRPTGGSDRLTGLGHPRKFQRLSRLRFVTAATSLNGSQPNFARYLAISLAGRPFIHFRQLLPCNGILPDGFSKSCTLLYWQPYCTAHAVMAVGASQTLRR